MRIYTKYRYRKNIRSKMLKRLIIVALLAFILIISFIKPSHEKQLINKAKEAKSQSHLIRTGYIQDKEKILEKDKAGLLSELLSKELGKPYIYGDEGPDSFDCSGLVKYVFSKMSIDLPRTASDQACIGIPVEENGLQFGDIVFFSADGVRINHVGIYVGNGYFEHAPKSGDVIKISSLESNYYKSTFKRAVRVLS